MFFRQWLLPCILLLLLLMSHLPSSILGLRTLREEDQEWSDLRRHEHEIIPPTVSPSQAVGDATATAASKYAVSRRMVPQGPNPLHNR
ncbi:hypothetical protein BAE44_0004721 [Dichanthelium oligosanthes]|uniref:Uncharacterized protein n=1 Tax=Dichanthelium oligosanthes TaxID=888268 RepID=A0A1E5WA51_9POAL|nr:hypothetical protein BAE44_0004721 [Dichanthelium oligosanthes]